MGLLDVKIKLKIKELDLNRRFDFPKNGKEARCFFLKTDGETVDYALQTELIGGWNIHYDTFRGITTLKYATKDGPGFIGHLEKTTHIAILDESSVDADIYTINEDGDLIKPKGRHPFWSIPIEATGEFYTVP